jgi:hypothetical protein
MAIRMTISYRDVNGVEATNRFTVADATAAAAALAKFKALTNAKIIEAFTSTPLDITGLSGNTALQANVESAKFKCAISMSGPIPTGGTRRPTVSLQIPAPLGSLVNSTSGDITNALVTTLLSTVLSDRGETLDTVDAVNFVR